MKGEYEITPRADGNSWLLRRLGKDGKPYEIVPLSRKSEKNGEIVYVDSNGKLYIQLSDGRLQESIALDTPATVSQSSGKAPVQLMTSPPVLPRSLDAIGVRSGNITLPKGQQPLRSEGGLLYLNTGVDAHGLRHEVAVQKVADRWYIRISVSDDPDVAPAFKIEDDGTISGYRQLPRGVPQVSAITGGNNEPDPGSRSVEYQGRKGSIFIRTDANGTHTYLSFEGQPGLTELDPVRGLTNLFTPRGNNDITIVVDRQGKLTVTDANGRPASIPNGLPPVTYGQPLKPKESWVPPRDSGARVYSYFDYQKTGEDEVTIRLDVAPGVNSIIKCRPVRDENGRVSDDQCLRSSVLYVRTALPDGQKSLSVIDLRPR